MAPTADTTADVDYASSIAADIISEVVDVPGNDSNPIPKASTFDSVNNLVKQNTSTLSDNINISVMGADSSSDKLALANGLASAGTQYRTETDSTTDANSIPGNDYESCVVIGRQVTYTITATFGDSSTATQTLVRSHPVLPSANITISGTEISDDENSPTIFTIARPTLAGTLPRAFMPHWKIPLPEAKLNTLTSTPTVRQAGEGR